MVVDFGPQMLSVNVDLPVTTTAGLIDYAKTNPGKLSYAVDVTAGAAPFAARLLNKRANLGMVEAPYRSAAQMVQDVASGTVPVLIYRQSPRFGRQQASRPHLERGFRPYRYPPPGSPPTCARIDQPRPRRSQPLQRILHPCRASVPPSAPLAAPSPPLAPYVPRAWGTVFAPWGSVRAWPPAPLPRQWSQATPADRAPCCGLPGAAESRSHRLASGDCGKATSKAASAVVRRVGSLPK